MILIENTEVMGWEHAIRGMRNPMNSWDRSDSFWEYHPCGDCNGQASCVDAYKLGDNDHELMMKLSKGGPVHGKFRRMIAVYVDITAPLYWWKEFDTYKVGTVANSCSTMHKIHAKRFELDDFSHEHLGEDSLSVLRFTIDYLNKSRNVFIEASSHRVYGVSSNYVDPVAKDHWWQMIQLLPSSYNQKRTIMLNYEVLAGIYKYRRDHKLDEWRELCLWIEALPYGEIITCEVAEV